MGAADVQRFPLLCWLRLNAALGLRPRMSGREDFRFASRSGEPVIDLLVQRELKSPNKWQGRHWRYKHRESQDWQTAIAVEMLTQKAQRNVWALLYASNDLGPKRFCEERRLVSVGRLVPSLRNFIRDDDNLRFSTKPLNDALKRLGLIHDDSRKWLQQTLPIQEVSSDGKYYTRIVIASLSREAE